MTASDTWAADFDAEIKATAAELARKHDLAALASMVAACAPDNRNAYTVNAKIPWRLILAIRIRQGSL